MEAPGILSSGFDFRLSWNDQRRPAWMRLMAEMVKTMMTGVIEAEIGGFEIHFLTFYRDLDFIL